MKGFVISNNETRMSVGVSAGSLLSIQFHSFNYDDGCCYVMVSGTDYEKKARIVWLKNTPVNLNDLWRIEFGEIDDVAMPVESVADEFVRKQVSKLESFRNIENYLKEKGLL